MHLRQPRGTLPWARDEMPEVPSREQHQRQVLRGMCCAAGEILCQLREPGFVHRQVLCSMWTCFAACCGPSTVCFAKELHTPAPRRKDSDITGNPRRRPQAGYNPV